MEHKVATQYTLYFIFRKLCNFVMTIAALLVAFQNVRPDLINVVKDIRIAESRPIQCNCSIENLNVPHPINEDLNINYNGDINTAEYVSESIY